MADQSDPSEETILEIALLSGIDVPEDLREEQLERLRTRLAATRTWRDRTLGFSFDDEAGFSYVHPAHVHRHRWNVPTPMNGNRAVEPETDE